LKILEMHLKKGFVRVVPQSLDDLWHLYNIVYSGDQVSARTTRMVKVQEEYSRPQEGRRIMVSLRIKVENVIWERSLNRLRIRGVITDIPEAIGGRGSYHTLNVVVDQPLTIIKSKWLKHQVDRLEKARHVEGPLILLASIDDEEYAVAVLRQYGLEVKAEKRVKLPGKLEPQKREEAFKAFFKDALSLTREAWKSLKCPIVVLGLGFVKNSFVDYVQDTDEELAAKIVDVKGVHSSGVSGINEAIRSGVLTKTLKNARMAEETKHVEEVLARLGAGKNDVTYGLNEVTKATQYGAVERLLITDKLLRESPDEKRLELERIMREAEKKGAQVTVVSTEHEAGHKLESLSGIAALLRFQVS